MSLSCIKLRISLLLLCLQLVGFSQRPAFDTALFYKHLVTENLFTEQIAFARQIQHAHISNTILQDSMRLSISLAYTKIGNTDSSEKNLVSISATPVFSVPSAELYVSLLIVRKEYSRAANFLNRGTNTMPTYFKEAGTCLKMLQNEPTLMDTDVSAYAPALLEIKNKYENPPHHSALLAGIYSAVIPGMGKLYLGYKEEALSAFIENIALAAQAAESYYKAGPKSVRFIVTGSLFGLFYGGNIWGSAVLAKKQKRDHRKQIEYEIYNYYNTRIAGNLQ